MSCAVCCVRKGLIFLMLCNANLQDRAVFAMWFLKVSWSSKITPRFLTELDGVIFAQSIWMVKSCCRVGVVGKTRSSVFTRLSCRWCSFIYAEMSGMDINVPLIHTLCIYLYIYIYIYIYIHSISQKRVHPSQFCKYFIISFHVTTLKKRHFASM